MTKPKKDLLPKLVQELHAVRADLDIILDQYAIRVKSVIAECLRQLEGEEIIGDKTPAPSPEQLRKALDLCKRTKIKPKQGRSKDLRRLQNLTDRLAEIFMEESR
ncbi:MAG: hypothetical protein JXQ27_10320 [Acidobacteria bacterium]|nr:hypothetical protein [Acidobacteriota bacterium]